MPLNYKKGNASLRQYGWCAVLPQRGIFSFAGHKL